MIDTNPMNDKNLAQKDEDLIKNIASEAGNKDKKQNEIEEQIELGYIRLKTDINKTLTPLIQAMTEAGVDGGLLASIEEEIYSDARKSFFSRVMNSDISNIEEISKSVQKESLKQLTPLFKDGEITYDVSELKQGQPTEFDYIINEMLKEKDKETDNKEKDALEEYDYKTGKDWHFKNKDYDDVFSKDAGTTSIESLKENERRIVGFVDKNTDVIEQLIKDADSSDPEKSKEAKMILSLSSTVIGFGDAEKEFSALSAIEKENAITSLYLLGRLSKETKNELPIELIKTFSDILQIDDIFNKDGSVNLDKIAQIASKEGINLNLAGPDEKIMDETHWIKGFVNYSSAKDFMVSSVIATRYSEMNNETMNLMARIATNRISLEDAEQQMKNILPTNIDAANRLLISLNNDMPLEYTADNIEFYNKTIQAILNQYLDAPKGYEIDEYVLQTLFEGMADITRPNVVGQLDPQTLELIGKVVGRNMELIENGQVPLQVHSNLYLSYQDLDFRMSEYQQGKTPVEVREDYQMKSSTESRTVNDVIADDKLLEDLKVGIAREAQSKGVAAAQVRLDALKNIYSSEVVAKAQQFIDSKECLNFDVRTEQEIEQERAVERRKSIDKYLDNMSGMIKTAGVEKTQEYIQNSLKNARDKGVIIEAAIEFLEQQKDDQEHFYDDDRKELRTGVYSGILLTGIQSPEIFERMKVLDRDAAKNAVNRTIDATNKTKESIAAIVEAVNEFGKDLFKFMDEKNISMPVVDKETLVKGSKEEEREPGD